MDDLKMGYIYLLGDDTRIVRFDKQRVDDNRGTLLRTFGNWSDGKYARVHLSEHEIELRGYVPYWLQMGDVIKVGDESHKLLDFYYQKGKLMFTLRTEGESTNFELSEAIIKGMAPEVL